MIRRVANLAVAVKCCRTSLFDGPNACVLRPYKLKRFVNVRIGMSVGRTSSIFHCSCPNDPQFFKNLFRNAL